MSLPILFKAIGFVLVVLALVGHPGSSSAFVLAPPCSKLAILARNAVVTNDAESVLKSPQETKVYEFLKELSDSDLSFRIVVVGNGAILESTNPLGPTFKVAESPKTGASIVTFASEDQSFEFHLMPAQIASAGLVSRPRPDGTTMRILRLLNAEGGSVCSLIVSEDSEKAQSWYESLESDYGSEVQF